MNAIVNYLTNVNGPRTSKEIADKLGLTVQETRNQLQELKNEISFEKIDGILNYYIDDNQTDKTPKSTGNITVNSNKIIAYKATDGMLFENEQDCINYENKLTHEPMVDKYVQSNSFHWRTKGLMKKWILDYLAWRNLQ